MANFNRYQNIADLVTRVAVGVGLQPTNDPFSNPDPTYLQLTTLANEVGMDLLAELAWNRMERTHKFVTKTGDTGTYDLPEDFAYMIDQTAWQSGAPGAAYPLLGPATNQWWSFLEATQTYNVSIYAWFQVSEGKLQLWPQPPPPDIPIQYSYVSRAWVQAGTSTFADPVYKDNVSTPSDIVLFPPILFVKKLKLAFLQAKGFDTTKAQDEYVAALDAWGGKDKPAMKLSLNNRGQQLWRPLDSIVNLPETGWG